MLLLAHWIGDFLFQTTKMAIHKSSSFKWLFLHVTTYTIVIFIFATLSFSWQVALGYTVINGVLHLVVDFFTSKLAAKYVERPRIFYPILGFDQLIHIACLYWTYLNSDILAL
ncbi:DUF3307 domain-containing protein [Croceitalea rosinachiae]|uniref:DUF3307 domain-containing protein n=1 Tax=Croceitalea rosinachiae TaxID=3075596 RepID=A0ABU3A6H6_9FLAO|nr:DUF3307 domain-containing protein [Croceitalea sp. F388]MDT0605505.1 DUF3307 domain-containing protein [Croceitalea sp. F388]